MNLQDVANIGEVLSGLGVIATLGYLAVQIRQSAKVSRAEIRQQLAGQQLALISTTGADPVLRVALHKALSGEDLSEDERIALLHNAVASLRLFESYHALWEEGFFTER